MFKDDANVEVKQEFNCAGISGASKETNQVNDQLCLEEQSPTNSNDTPKNIVIHFDIESSLVDESPPNTSFRVVIGTTDIDFLGCLFKRINKHGTRCYQWFANCITADKYLSPPSILCQGLFQNCPTTTMYAHIHPALLMYNTFTTEKMTFSSIISRGLP